MGYSLNSQQLRERTAREYLAERAARNPNLTPSRTYTNARTSGLYTGNNMGSARSDADQHFQYTGAGFKPQIALSSAPSTSGKQSPIATLPSIGGAPVRKLKQKL